MTGTDVVGDVASMLAVLVATAGLVLATATWAVTRIVDPALPVLLDFLTAAGLLRLTADQEWRAIGSVALILVVRRVVSAGIRRSRSSRSSGPPRPTDPRGAPGPGQAPG